MQGRCSRWVDAPRRVGLVLLCTLLTAGVSGCARLASSALEDFTAGLSTAILNQDDPELVRESLPAYLLILDSLAADPRAGSGVLAAAARLYAAYAVVFVEDETRAATLATRARGYGSRALCAADRDACALANLPFAEFQETVRAIGPRGADGLFGYAIGSLAFIRTHGGDWQALAELPRVEEALKRLLEIGPADLAPGVNTYLGILNTLRPPALGGRPEEGRAYFERALQLTDGRDLSVKVEYARGYARLVYDRELHDRLLREVVDAPVEQPGLTLFNVLAVQQARELLATADDYF